MDELIDILLDTLLDTAKIVPFLFLTYLFLEWLEQENEHKLTDMLEKHKKASVSIGSLLALFPSCGFSGAASSLYSTGVISLGALIAVYLSTNDEMLPIMLSSGVSFDRILPILLTKLVIALAAGYAIDLVIKKKSININEFCEREHDDHSHGLLHSAILHTAQVTVWLFVITLIFNSAVEWIGMDTLRTFIASYPNRSVLVCGIVGMIPSCASSVLLSTMYAENVISFASVCTGLLANAGTGIMVLWRVHPNRKENAGIMLLLWMIALGSGAVLNLFL